VAEAWRICDPILAVWADGDAPLARYEAGSWGPREADLLLQRDGRRWRQP
jgi:glucose-6-phosphate 1-dehydrogenase